MAPTVYQLDSAELPTGAAILGIVHAPGYPLYTLICHLFTQFPIGDVAYRVNLFSALCLALTAPLVYSIVVLLLHNSRVAAVAALTLVWSYYVWDSGTAAEIYAPQIVTLALCGWWLARLYHHHLRRRSDILIMGLLVGLAISMGPSSVFFAPGLVIAFLVMRIPVRLAVGAAVIGAVFFLCTLLYFPLRASADPDFNKIGQYDENGVFHNFDYSTPAGIAKAISGDQFHNLFFVEGYLPTINQLGTVFSWFWRNYLGIGVILGLFGALAMMKRERWLFLCWLALFLPYTYFYLCYGAVDRDTMFGPSYLMWAILFAYGLNWLLQHVPEQTRSLAYVIPAAMLLINFGAVDLSQATSTRSYAETVLKALPENAVVLGYWPDVAPMQYMHFVEHQRPDVKIYDVFLFPGDTLRGYLDNLQRGGIRPVVVTTRAIPSVVGMPYAVEAIWTPASRDSQLLLRQPMIVGFLLTDNR